MKGRQAASVADRFWEGVDRSGGDESCWLWMRSVDRAGYARFYVGGKRRALVHRWSYEHVNGPIPVGLVIDHLCHNAAAEAGLCEGGDSCPHRRCVNPSHLMAVTQAENLAAAPTTPAGMNARKTHCVNGHEFTPANTKIRTDGARECRTCRRHISRRAWARRSAALAADQPEGA